ncbi:MAG: L-serine ammonia-lyase, iron-sulfur-dependent, subunit alpha [Planctomycetes bacterium]|nr:L-serine ammonia-lyase, iron-sulfur-dependent, subunit alpha [Planctomycetota bacterium]MBL7044127.1 L-serine ammonia-lyase, iron-sulfur-dependent, subunit alpha [Pirellulaceae bacterium]
MRGPSSSHCAAALRIGRLARDLMDGDLQEVLVEFDRHGALATTHESQGSDMGLFGGLMGWPADDERLPDSPRYIRDAGVQVATDIVNSADRHPNTYRLTLRNAREQHSLVAISSGGGMMEIVEIDGLPVSINGDYQETLIFPASDGEAVASELAEVFDADEILVRQTGDRQLVQVKAQQFVSDATLSSLRTAPAIGSVHRLATVLPVMSRKNLTVPFSTCQEMLDHDGGRKSPLWQLAVEYEMARGQLSQDEVFARMTEIVRILRRSIEQGIDGTQYQDRILGHQCGVFKSRMDAGRLLAAGVLNRIVLYVTALMEVKSSMGVIVAAPTAGACGALPGACLAVADEMNLPDEAVAKAMLAAGLVGVFIATRSTFAAEVAGCQAETGAAAPMAAAALVTLADGTTSQAMAAASMALQNSLGMICDPVAGRVEVPCLGKNVLAASNALSCANMALADYDPVIPLDEVIEAADRVGRSLPRELRCTALGGLAVSQTSQEIAARLAENKPCPGGNQPGRGS